MLVATTAACASDDPPNSSGSNTSTASLPKISDTIDAEWGDLAECATGPAGQEADVKSSPATEGVADVESFGKLAQDHVDGCVDSPVRPAVGGPHHSPWANCGLYTSPIPEEAAVHDLEHGAVWISFSPDASDATLELVRSKVEASTHVVASPYPGLAADEIILSAWSRQLSLDSVDTTAIESFLSTYIQGPQTPEQGAPCDGGLGTPSVVAK